MREAAHAVVARSQRGRYGALQLILVAENSNREHGRRLAPAVVATLADSTWSYQYNSLLYSVHATGQFIVEPCSPGVTDVLARSEVTDCKLLPSGSNYVFL